MSKSQQKKTSRIPGYRTHKTGQAFVRLNGKNIYLGKAGMAESRAEYERVVGQWLTTNRRVVPSPRSGPVEDRGVTVDQLLAEFFAVRVPQKYYRDGKPTRYVASLKEALPELRALYGETHIADFGPRALVEVKNEMIRRRGSISQTTLSKRLGIIRSIVKWGIGMEIVDPGVLVKLNAARLAERRSLILAPDAEANSS